MITIQIEEDDALDMLMNRFYDFTGNEPHTIAYKLFEQMYESAVYGGVFDDGEFNVMAIVDNDWVNYCDVLFPDDDGYDEVLEAYHDNGDSTGDISTSTNYSYIEAVVEDEGKPVFLVRM